MRISLSSFALRGSFCLLAALSTPTHARKTDFSEDHSGLLLSIGTYPSSNPEGSDPLPQMVPLGTEVTGSSSTKILPLRVGYFIDRSPVTFEVYYKYITNTGATWGTKGGFVGAGKSKFKSSGGGAQLVFHLLHSQSFRLGALAQAEFISQTVSHQFNTTGEPTQKISLGHSTSTLGGGLQADIWLGDLWVLTNNFIYHYGTESAWRAKSSDYFLGRSWDKGNILNPRSGEPVKGTFSGFLIEVGFKLNFYSF